MKSFRFLVFPIIFTMVPLMVFAQSESIKDVDLLKQYDEVLLKENPHRFEKIRVDSVYRIDKKHSKIIFHENGRYSEAVVNSFRKDLLLVALFEEVPSEMAPKIVVDSFKSSEYKDKPIKRILKGRTPYEGWFYSFDILKNNEIERIYFSDLGEYQKPPY